VKILPTVLERQRTKRVALYSHKGGVGKTTLTANLAFALAEAQHNVLLIDSDPQCSLSACLLDEKKVDNLLDASDTEKGETIWSSLKWVQTAEQEPAPVEPLPISTHLHLLPGDIRMSEFEEDLQESWKKATERQERGFAGCTALSLVANSICARHAVDVLFYDCGPNTGPLNRTILLDCDFFIIPVACDEFSVRAVRTLGYTLARWLSQWSDIADLAPDGTYLLPGRPRFLGYIAQQFRVYGGEITQEFGKFLDRIDRQVRADVVNVMGQFDPDLISDRRSYEFGQIQNLSSIVAASQRMRVPVWAVNEGSSYTRETAKDQFYRMADRIAKETVGGGK